MPWAQAACRSRREGWETGKGLTSRVTSGEESPEGRIPTSGQSQEPMSAREQALA